MNLGSEKTHFVSTYVSVVRCRTFATFGKMLDNYVRSLKEISD